MSLFSRKRKPRHVYAVMRENASELEFDDLMSVWTRESRAREEALRLKTMIPSYKYGYALVALDESRQCSVSIAVHV